MTPNELKDRVLFEDGRMIVIDKPAGLPVHAGPKAVDDLERHLDVLRGDWPKPPLLVHRLDADTAGCLVLARHRKALKRLNRLFEQGLATKTYWAVVVGTPKAETGTSEAPLDKVSTKEAGWRMVVAAKGKPAVTDWRVLGRGGGLSWLELKPRTGRTHQLRVHCAHLGCPILGDPAYGAGLSQSDKFSLQLLARRIELPVDPPVDVTAPIPDHMRPTLGLCGWRG